MFKVVDNFLDEKYFKQIQETMFDRFFPWYYNDVIADSNDTKSGYYFTHNFYNDIQDETLQPGVSSSYFNLLVKFLKQIECKSIIRVKGNLYVSKNKKQIHQTHIDYEFLHKGCILYINDNDGLTYFGKKQVKPKANRVVFFDPSKNHSSSLPINNNRRVNINVNYF